MGVIASYIPSITTNLILQKPEIMSPAGYWPQLRAAVEAGADAVYFGLDQFTARAKVGFRLEELPEVLRHLHERGVKGYVTFNTLVFDSELERAAQLLAALAEAGPDALIVQDLGVARLAREMAPELEIHGSTQMSITNAAGVRMAQDFGVRRVVLARELSLAEVRALREEVDCELELFVHGALCVSYSGQCFSSEAWGGRSANRGQCAQACRLPYDLLVDGQQKPLGDARYLLSPGDLYALQQVPALIEIGIAALKIEGRYKDADYVALTTRAYRRAVDEAWAGGPLSIDARGELELEQVYSRGLGPFFISGTNHQEVVRARAPRHRGVKVGTVCQVLAQSVLVEVDARSLVAPLKAGDGVVFDAADWRDPAAREEGGHIYHVRPRDKESVELEFANNAIDFSRIRVGDWVWRTHDPQLKKAARPYTRAVTPLAKQRLGVAVVARVGQALSTRWYLLSDPDIAVQVYSDIALPVAQNRALEEEYLREQFARLGNTPYELAELELLSEGRPFAPASLLGKVRQQAVAELAVLQGRPHRVAAAEPLATLVALQGDMPPASAGKISEPQLHLLVRTPEQLEAALAVKVASITLDYLDLYGLRPAVEKAKASGVEVRVASPRITKQGEERIAQFLLNLQCPILVRSGGLLQTLQATSHPPLIGDFSLNAANVLSAQALLAMGLERLAPTHDLNAQQVAELARGVGAGNIEVVAYQHLPVFHTEHCVFCRFLSEGTSYRDCGKPCESHRIALRDGQGRAHPVLADVGCRNTVFGAEAQEASAHLQKWQAVGIEHWRLEFAHETAAEVTAIAGLFAQALNGALTAKELGRQLKEYAPQGSTEGSLFVPDAAWSR
jgi:U32 family peptidase